MVRYAMQIVDYRLILDKAIEWGESAIVFVLFYHVKIIKIVLLVSHKFLFLLLNKTSTLAKKNPV